MALFNQQLLILMEVLFLFKNNYYHPPEIEVSAYFLPDKERSDSISFEKGITILGENGSLVMSSVQNDVLSFSECKQLSGKKSH